MNPTSTVATIVLALALPFTFGCTGELAENETDTSTAAVAGGTKLSVTRATASSDDGNTPDRVLDGKLSTRWSAEGDGQWIDLALGADADLVAVNIAFYKGSQRTMRFDLATSLDGKTYTTVRSGLVSSGKTKSLQTFTIPATRARYVRVIGHGSSENAWNSLTEIEVYGQASVTPPAPTTTTTTTTPPPPPPPPSAGTVAYPSDLLDLSIWKLTLPIAASGGSGPQEITALDDYAIDPYFRLTDAKDGVRFRAHAGGVTTSGSSYPRSELREMTASGARAAWSTSSGKHTMLVREAITHTPAVKPHVVAAQIHDASDDVVMVRLEGARLFVEGGGDELALLDAKYVLGTPFDVALVAEGGKIRVSYNGVEKLAYAKSTSGCYFKAGAYTQSNTSKGDAASAYGEVVIQSLTVRHE